jgi:hypothetical protein
LMISADWEADPSMNYPLDQHRGAKMERRNFVKRVAGALACLPRVAKAFSGSLLPVSSATMPDSFDPPTNSAAPASRPDYGALLAQHDVAYLSPATRPVEGLPIGDGDTVALAPSFVHLGCCSSPLYDS